MVLVERTREWERQGTHAGARGSLIKGFTTEVPRVLGAGFLQLWRQMSAFSPQHLVGCVGAWRRGSLPREGPLVGKVGFVSRRGSC